MKPSNRIPYNQLTEVTFQMLFIILHLSAVLHHSDRVGKALQGKPLPPGV